MTNRMILAIGAAATLAVGAPALADNHAGAEMKAEVVERNSRGQATKVSVGGTVYAVCMGDMSDNCINPRSAGLNWGNRELDHWPGQPASSM